MLLNILIHIQDLSDSMRPTSMVYQHAYCSNSPMMKVLAFSNNEFPKTELVCSKLNLITWVAQESRILLVGGP